MVNRRLKPEQMLSLIRKLARKNDLSVRELPRRGKGSHTMYILVRDDDDTEVANFGLTGHPKDLSRSMMHKIEDQLESQFGKKWTEKR